MTQFRVGIVGLRRGLGPTHMFALQPDCRVVAGCDIDATARERFQHQFPEAQCFSDYDDMLASGPDIIFVASPVPAHWCHTVAALEAGCDVLQEVTLASTVDECRQLLNAVLARPKQKFMLAENCCYWAHILSWQSLWQQGRLGDFMYAEAEYVPDTRHLLRDVDGSPAWRATMPPMHYCTHSLGPLLKITGERCVTAINLPSLNKLGADSTRPDLEVALFQTASGGIIKILCAFGITREPMFPDYGRYHRRAP